MRPMYTVSLGHGAGFDMQFLRENWFWIVVFVFFILMHAGGHGGHGGHGRSGRTSRPDERERQDAGGPHRH